MPCSLISKIDTEEQEPGLKVIMATVALCLLVGGCASTQRTEISFAGTLVLPEGAELPDGYSIFLMEERRQHSVFGTAILPVAELRLDANNQFSYNGDVCRNPQLLIPYGNGVGLSNTPKFDKSAILIELTSAQFASAKELIGGVHWQRTRQAAADFQTEITSVDYPESFPC